MTRIRPTRAGVGLVVGSLILFGVGTNVQAGWLLVLAALLLGTVAAGIVLPFAALRGLHVERRSPATAWAGDGTPVTLAVRNASASVRGLVMVEDDFLGVGRAVVTRLESGEVREYTGIRHGARRGVHTRGRCTLVTGAPFGIVTISRAADIESRTVVYPRIFAVPALDTLVGTGDAGVPRRAEAGDTASVREYRPGDPLRHVHWRSTARTGRLVVRDFEDAAASDVHVVAGTRSSGESLDVVAAVACSLALAALDSGRRVRLGSVGVATSRRDVLEWCARITTGDAPLGEIAKDASILCVVHARTDGDLLRRLDGADVVPVVLDPHPGEEAALCFARAAAF